MKYFWNNFCWAFLFKVDLYLKQKVIEAMKEHSFIVTSVSPARRTCLGQGVWSTEPLIDAILTPYNALTAFSDDHWGCNWH